MDDGGFVYKDEWCILDKDWRCATCGAPIESSCVDLAFSHRCIKCLVIFAVEIGDTWGSVAKFIRPAEVLDEWNNIIKIMQP